MPEDFETPTVSLFHVFANWSFLYNVGDAYMVRAGSAETIFTVTFQMKAPPHHHHS